MQDIWKLILFYCNHLSLKLVCKRWNEFILTFPVKAKQHIPKEYFSRLNISHLGLTDVKISDIDMVPLHSKLISLNLTYNKTIKNIELFTNLRSLDLSYNEVITHVPKSVTHLTLENNYTIKTETLKTLPLSKLSLNVTNNITDISFLTNLTNLDLSGNSSITIDTIKHLKLKKLRLWYYSSIRDVSPFTSLRSLDLEYNQCEIKINLPDLHHLNIVDTKFIPDLKKLTGLRKLDIGDNLRDYDIKDLKLTHLTIYNDYITENGLNLNTLKVLKIHVKRNKLIENELIKQLSKYDIKISGTDDDIMNTITINFN